MANPLNQYLSLARWYFSKNPNLEEMWRAILSDDYPALRRGRRLLGLLPSDDRCKNCHAPFRGIAAPIMRLVGRGPYDKNPRFCGW